MSIKGEQEKDSAGLIAEVACKIHELGLSKFGRARVDGANFCDRPSGQVIASSFSFSKSVVEIAESIIALAFDFHRGESLNIHSLVKFEFCELGVVR